MATFKITKVITGTTKAGKNWRLALFGSIATYDAATNTITVPKDASDGKSFICNEDDAVYVNVVIGTNVEFL